MNTAHNTMSAPIMTFRKSYFRLALEEPYRLFFPLATLAGLMAVSLWPLFYTGVLPFYPGVAHIRIMITGFMGGYIFGFLSTALPRMSGTPRFKDSHVLLLALLFPKPREQILVPEILDARSSKESSLALFQIKEFLFQDLMQCLFEKDDHQKDWVSPPSDK
ncbi:NnrS family protein [Patescibacteria group bacterium]|nr:NnrS family protein [Patescibacteria group bacterium]